jgi:hypothetical protein
VDAAELEAANRRIAELELRVAQLSAGGHGQGVGSW